MKTKIWKKKLNQHRPQIAKNNFCGINVENSVTSARSPRQFFWVLFLGAIAVSTPPKLVVTLAPNHSTLQWHPAMAPRPLPQSSSFSTPPTIAHYNSTLQWPPQWHHVHSPSSPYPPNHSTLQWHPTMAPNNAPRPLPQSWSSPYPPTIAHYNGTLRCHPAMAPWCHVQSAKVVRRPPPLVEVRTPIAIAIREKTWMKMYLYFLTQKISMTVFPAIVMVSFWGVQNPFFWIATW